MATMTGAPPAGPSRADVDSRLRELAEVVDGYEQRMRRLVDLIGEVTRSGLIEDLEGLPMEEFLGLRFRLTRSEVWMLQTAADCLRDMPSTKRLWREQTISWSQVRQIVDGAKKLAREQRRVLDARLAASRDLLDAMDPDRLAWAVDREVEELRGLRPVRDAERRQEKANFISVQQAFDGRGSFYGQMDPIGLATVVGAWDAAANDLEAAGDDVPSKPSQRRAAGAVAVAGDYLAGGHRSGRGIDKDGGEERGPRRARPLINLVVDVGDCTATAAGQVLLDAPGALPTITKTALRRILESDHDCRAVLFDGQRPLAVSNVINTARLPAKTRLAVRLRDRGGRMPGSRTPAGQTHIHHLDRARYGHHPDHLVALGVFGHLRLAHTNGWKLTLDPDTGQVTARWHHRTYRTLPWGTRLNRAPPAD